MRQRHLRPYQAADFDAIFALDKACFAPPFGFSKATMRSLVNAPGAVVRVACEQDAGGREHVVAFCIANREQRADAEVGYVSTLDVAPESRGRGLGRTLMMDAEAALRREGVQRLELHVFRRNEAAIRLYERMGFACTAAVADFYGAGLDAMAYAKPLRGG